MGSQTEKVVYASDTFNTYHMILKGTMKNYHKIKKLYILEAFVKVKKIEIFWFLFRLFCQDIMKTIHHFCDQNQGLEKQNVKANETKNGHQNTEILHKIL